MRFMLPAGSAAEAGSAARAGSSERRVWRAGTLTYTTGGLVLLFCWLLWGDFAWSMKERSIASVVQLLLRRFEASDLLVGLLIGSLPAVLTMVLGPIVSYRSDRHRGRWGRRIPFLAIPTPIAALSIVGLAFCPVIGRRLHDLLGDYSPGLNPSILICFCLFWTLFEVATVTANAVFVALINDVVPGVLLGRFHGMFRALSLIAGMIFNFWLLGKSEEHYLWIFIGIGTLYGVGFTLMCLKVEEGKYPDPPRPRDERLGFRGATKTYFRECFTHPFYLWVFLATNLPLLAFIPINVFSVFFAKSVGMGMDVYGKCLALTYLVSLALSYFLGALADRFHPVRIGLATIVLYAAAVLWGGLFATNATFFAIALIAHGVLGGAWHTATASLGQRLYPKARFAQFASAQAMLLSLGTMMLAPLVGSFLDYSGQVYRYTFLIGFVLAAMGVLSTIVLSKRFNALGGARGYVAPGETSGFASPSHEEGRDR